MALEPQVYMFDEPTAGMSHDEAPVILNLIRELKKDKTKIILLVEHKMDVVRELADRIIVLTNGTLVADGAPAEADCIARGAGGVPGHQPGCRARTQQKEAAVEQHRQPPGAQRAYTRTLARLTSCTAWISPSPKASSPCCWAATARARRPRCAPSWAWWQASQGSIHFNGRDITRLHTPQIAGLNIAYVPENMGIFADLTVKENLLLAARKASNAAQMDAARLQWIFRLFPAVGEVLEPPRRQAQRRTKQMLAVSPRHHRAAPTCSSWTSPARAWRPSWSTT